MFNKTKPIDADPRQPNRSNPSQADLAIPAPPALALRPDAPRRSEASTSLSTLSAGVKYEGNITGAGELHVDGGLKGDIRVVHVVIGETGSVDGSVHADVLEVRGRVAGSIVAKQVHLHSTARIEGDITQEQISIERGASFQGRCTQAKREQAPTTPPQLAATLSKPLAPKPDGPAEAKID